MKKIKGVYRVFLRTLLVSLSFLIMFTMSQAETTSLDISVKIDGVSTLNGAKAVKTNPSIIDIEWKSGTYTINEGRSLDEITMTAKNGGQKEESYKFDVVGRSNGVQLKAKTYNSNGVIKTYELQKHTLYTIHIPEGLLSSVKYIIEDGKLIAIKSDNKDTYFDFVTIGDGGLNDIMASFSPKNLQDRVDRADSIVYEFVDNVSLNPILNSNIELYKKSYVNITSQSLSSSITGYQSDSMDNFTLSVDKNKLIIKRKNGEKLKDYSKYTVKLLDGAIQLKNTSSGVGIYNGSGVNKPGITTVFNTNKTVAETDPENNEKSVSLEPTVRIKFNYPLYTVNTSTILYNMKLRIGGATGELVTLNTTNTNIYADNAKNELVIEFNDKNSKNSFLRPNAPYHLWINQGVITMKVNQNVYITNEQINIDFSTVGSSDSLKPIGYSSSDDMDDDIRKLDSTDLENDGSIYIKFDGDIRFDKVFQKELDSNPYSPSLAINKYFFLYDTETTRVEHDYSQKYNNEIHMYNFKREDRDSNGIMETYVYTDGTTDVSQLSDITKLRDLSISKVEIIEDSRILKITPKNPLKGLNRYILKIDRDAIENKQGYNVESDIQVTFWTEESDENLEGIWKSVENHLVSDIKEENPYFEMPRYGETFSIVGTPKNIYEHNAKKTIIVDVEGEIIPKASENLFKSLADFSTIKDYYARTKNTDGTYSDVTVEIDKIAMEYYIKDNKKHTKLYIYPKQLQYGRRYSLEIPANVFESRAGDDLPNQKFYFVVESRNTGDKGILKLDNSAKSVIDIYEEPWEILVRGYNLNGDIAKVEIMKLDNSEPFDIPLSNIEFQDVTTIKVKLQDDKKKEFLEKYTSIGTKLQLKLKIQFNGAAPNIFESDEIILNPKTKPPVKDNDTSDIDVRYDEKELNKRTIDGEDKYFLKITFKDTDLDGDGRGELQINQIKNTDGSINYLGLSKLMDESSLTATGSSKSLIDTDFIRNVISILGDTSKSQDEKNKYLEYIFEKDSDDEEAYLYVPIKPLSSQITYNVTVAANVVTYSSGGEGNDSIKWSLTTMADPVVTDMLVGSVGEDYDEDEPIIITGEFFYDTVDVYFNDTKAEDVDIEKDDDGSTYLEVYLPEGSDRLEPGIYNIFIENDDNHKRELYGVFSVVKEGDTAPTEEYISTDVSKGEMRAEIKVSENTVILKSKYADEDEVELDLDELMGKNVLVRKVVIEGDEDDEIGLLSTKSRWANIDLYDVSLEDDSEDDDLTLTLGRTEASFGQALKKKLNSSALKSDFIRVGTKNCTIEKVILKIPFKRANIKKLKALRYDEETRNFYVEKATINPVDSQVTIESKEAGIFIVVED